MKITAVESFLLSAPRDLHIVRVETDAGLHGLGEAGVSTREHGQEGVLRHLREWLIGKDPRRIEDLWQAMYRGAYYEGGRILSGAISAVDMALHDILGKHLDVPVWQLLGGACRERVYAFCTLGKLHEGDPVARAQQAAEEGWPAIRFSQADGPRSEADPDRPGELKVLDIWSSIAETARRFTEVWESLGSDVPLGIDYHHQLSVAEAATFCQRIPRGSLAFLEEPIRCQTPDAYARLREMTDVPFAIGEELTSKWEFLPYIERGLGNYCRVDVGCVGGLTEAKKIAGLCEAHYIDLMPHNPIGPVCTAATVHLCCACNNVTWMECRPEFSEAAGEVFPVTAEREGPAYLLPQRPGLGVEMDLEAARQHPMRMHEHPHLRRPDGSYTNW
jgi:galactonate dehydratase